MIVHEAPPMASAVLLVEDDDAVRDVIVRYLRAQGFDVVAAASAEEALDLDPPRAFDIVVTDVVLPGLDGFAMAAEIVRRTPHVRVHFISGHFDASMAIAAGLSPETTVLKKPFPLTALLELLRSAVAERAESTGS
jgi:DNA-binding NtrC family response regulator